MRAAQRQMCSRIRCHLPLNRTAKDINQFLTVMDQEWKRAEEHDSDEFI